MDRLCGLIGLLLGTLLCCVLCFNRILHFPAPLRMTIWGLCLGCFAGLAAAGGILFYDFFRKIPGVPWFFSFLDRHLGNACTNGIHAVNLYRKQWKVLLVWTVLSALLFFPLLAAVLLALSAGITGSIPGIIPMAGQMDTLTCFLASYLSQSAAVLPLTPGGIGVRDMICSEVLQASGVQANAALLIPLLNTVLLLVLSLCCSVFWV